MITQALELIKNPTKIITYILAGALVILGSMYAWEVMDNIALTSKVQTQKIEIEKTTDAEKSCKRTLKKLIANNKKKSEVLRRYKSKVEGADNDKKINNINDFINFANRLQ
ncbi:MAG TPA: hypothetical protein EYG74_06550 [Sulfurimonas autotrophica]|nr:hypothetical protein [Sulfurimonas autotrophica]